jgi:hypothetical protein
LENDSQLHSPLAIAGSRKKSYKHCRHGSAEKAHAHEHAKVPAGIH